MKKPVYVIDAMNYIFRAYHALPDNITAPSGMLTNAVLGYLRTLLRIIKERRPEYMAAAFEGATSFRSTMFAAYKATRKQTPDDLEAQFDYCRRITEAIGIACLEADDYEADDVIGTIAMRMTALGHPVVIVTGDKDMSQLVCDNVQIYDMAKENWLNESGVREKFGVAPSQIPDLLALHGDSVDNIPGVAGVGEKTARQILSVCKNVEDLAQVDFGDRVRFRGRDEILRRIRENMESVRISRKLATICCEVPMEISPDILRYRRGDHGQLKRLCAELGFARVMEDIPLAQPMLFS
jgi:DNA polymerase-1